MRFTESIRAAVRGWATYRGTSRRPEFWWFQLFAVLSTIVVLVVSAFIAAPFGDPGAEVATAVVFIYWVLLFAIGLSLTVRRLRDAGIAWGLIFLHLLPLLGPTLLYIFAVLPSKVSAAVDLYRDELIAPDEGSPRLEDETQSKLSRLSDLRDQGKISGEQFDAAKRRLLGDQSS